MYLLILQFSIERRTLLYDIHVLRVHFHVIGNSVLLRTQSDMSFIYQKPDINKGPPEVSLPAGKVYSQVSTHTNIILIMYMYMYYIDTF